LNKHPKIITFDGTAGSGKGTLAKRVAEYYGISHLDTGKLYRALALVVIRNAKQDNYQADLEEMVASFNAKLFEDGDLYSEEVSKFASKIAADQKVREALFDYQQDFIKSNQSCVLDGRDTGSVIAPQADYKFYVDANSKVRAERRYAQNQDYYDQAGISVAEIEANINARDESDKNRALSPLVVPEHAVVIDNTELPLDEIVKKITDLIDSDG